jgi:hypothetical protein
MAACNGCTEYECKPVPPLPPAIPACNATNYHEFWCTVTNVSESFNALATRLHVNPTKLCEYNFLYECAAGVTPNNSIRVPYDQCTPKPGVWNCYEVKDGDTLLSVASSAKSLNFDARALQNTNLDILYGESTLHAGMHLRLPLHICFEDELNDCHIVAVGDTLASVAATYNTTAQQLCSLNVKILVDAYCDPGIKPLPHPSVGMELAVPRPYKDPPSPCREIPGYWSCYTVKAYDTISGNNSISATVGAAADELIELNFGQNPNHCCDADQTWGTIGCAASPRIKGGCSNTSACPASKGPYPECLQIGQVLTVPVAPACVPRPGVWGCLGNKIIEQDQYWLNLVLHHRSFYCKANRRSFPACRNPKEDEDWSTFALVTAKVPYPICVPNDKSYCSDSNSAVDRDVYHNSTTKCSDYAMMVPLSQWDGNGLSIFVGEEAPWGCYWEYHIPRGALPVYPLGIECTPVPGEHLCHKPLPPVGPDGCWMERGCLWEDSVYQIAQQFGVDWEDLCALNQMKNCSAECALPGVECILNYGGSALRIPVR